MNKKFAKNLPEYDKVEFNKKAVLKARKISRKMPTSISLPPEVVDELKSFALLKGIPYQVLMRSFILEGLARMKKNQPN